MLFFLRMPLWIPSVLKPSALNNEGLEGITFIGPLLAACSSKAVSSLLPSSFMLFAALAMHAMCRSSSENTVSSKQSFIFHVFVNCLSISIIKKPAWHFIFSSIQRTCLNKISRCMNSQLMTIVFKLWTYFEGILKELWTYFEGIMQIFWRHAERI